MFIEYFVDGELFGVASLDKVKAWGVDVRDRFEVDGLDVRVTDASPLESFKLTDGDIDFIFDQKEKMIDLD